MLDHILRVALGAVLAETQVLDLVTSESAELGRPGLGCRVDKVGVGSEADASDYVKLAEIHISTFEKLTEIGYTESTPAKLQDL